MPVYATCVLDGTYLVAIIICKSILFNIDSDNSVVLDRGVSKNRYLYILFM